MLSFYYLSTSRFNRKRKKISHTPACGIHNDMEGLKKYYDVPDLRKSLELTMTHPKRLKKALVI